MTASIARARADLAAGRAWKARDRLNGLLADHQDPEILDLLATVHYEMRDLPAAGALWFVTGRNDEMAQDSVAAWRERYGNDESRWLSVPGPVRRRARSRHLSALEGAAKRVRAGRRPQWNAASYTYSERWWERFEPVIFGGLAIWALVMMGIGMWTVVQWILG